eukprot:TRINITY_DN1936_c1_g2_i1.p1 TRINITY_DN1936_c1_g2~~TRINITY_DN1936_c1_g2_i1.p1  ORF type:complete len:133 (-),score=9.67 TRINITY_DN1936_c1_g2_i1:24-422(-)
MKHTRLQFLLLYPFSLFIIPRIYHTHKPMYISIHPLSSLAQWACDARNSLPPLLSLRLQIVTPLSIDPLVQAHRPRAHKYSQQGNTIKRIGVTFGLLGSHEFLASGWSSDQFEDERNLLTDAMLRYTAFHFQ